MIKLCQVLFFNSLTHIVVAKYGDVQIQFITDRNAVGPSAYIKKDNAGYEIVEKQEYDKLVKAKKKEKNIVQTFNGIDLQKIVD